MNKPVYPIVDAERIARPSIAAIYADKPIEYFGRARHDVVNLLTTGPNDAVIELGCSAGGTGREVLEAGKAGRYVGLEMSEEAAFIAAQTLSEVHVGDVQDMDLSPFAGQFDALVASEVMEHLIDPWAVLKRLATCLKPGGQVVISVPNVAHWHVIRQLLLGRFRYQPCGVMDRTHLRWFTPEGLQDLLESANIEFVSLQPFKKIGWKAHLVNALTGGRFAHLFLIQIVVVGRLRA